MNPTIDKVITFHHTPTGLVVLRTNSLCFSGVAHFHEGLPIAFLPDHIDELADSLRTCARRARESWEDKEPSAKPRFRDVAGLVIARFCLRIAAYAMPRSWRPGRALFRGLNDALDAAKAEMTREAMQ